MVNAQPIVITIFLSLPEGRGRVEEVGPMSLYMEFFFVWMASLRSIRMMGFLMDRYAM